MYELDLQREGSMKYPMFICPLVVGFCVELFVETFWFF